MHSIIEQNRKVSFMEKECESFRKRVPLGMFILYRLMQALVRLNK